ncbi:MAG TPA: hypothetical protein VJT49_22555 [Amycolatopsis sp.]|uniref:hypothetical protein n=1 Tax=Amycolatopsis sp. TaxID=37632 RepID=UPI002B45CD7E|nr:hypothetical protein [Amycolatopsis sp.]HKS47842.1 hypothetical protein [Amycolatopsis sp.]
MLVEAIAARTRRKVRDGALAVLALLFLGSAWGSPLLHGWLLLAVLLSLPTIWRRSSSPQAAALKVTVLVGVVVVAPFALLGFSWESLRQLVADGLLSAEYSTGFWSIIALVLWFLMLAILVADRLVVWQLVFGRFGRRARHLPPSNPFDANRTILNLSPPAFVRQLVRYAAPVPDPGTGAPLVVHRGYEPFVGAGQRRGSWSVAIPLERLPEQRKPDGSEFGELTAATVYERIRAELMELQRSTPLSPDRRLRGLKISEAVYAGADKLVDRLNQPDATIYLPNPENRPNPSLPAEEVAARRAQPREWARYYLCVELAVWNRDLLLSGFLNTTVDESTLYLEWTDCVLPPIRDRYRSVDRPTGTLLTPIGQAVLRWLKLPMTILGRITHTLAVLLPAHRERGVFNPDSYGCLRTLREMAAADEVSNYFQLLDVARYEKIMHSRLVTAVSRTLRDCGYRPQRFEEQAAGLLKDRVTVA